MYRRQFLVTATALFVAFFILTSGARAASGSFNGSESGSFATIPLDIDDDSCVIVSGVTTCTGLSIETNLFGAYTGFTKANYSSQAVAESAPVPGTGCLIDTSIQGCTLGSSTDACEYSYEGGSFVNRLQASGVLLYGTFNAGGSICVDYSTFPFNFSAADGGTITGGTGTAAGVSGTFTFSANGQIMNLDLQGHQFGWFSDTSSGFLSKP